MKLTAAILEQPLAYHLWQAPFAEKKFEPVLAHNDLSRVRRVLDAGRGSGTDISDVLHSANTPSWALPL